MIRAMTVGVCALALAGCESGERVKPVDVEIKVALSPIEQMIGFLDHYAKGNPMGSEVSQFEPLLKAVRDTDPAKAEVLEKGFDKLRKAGPAQLKSQAAALIRQVSPNNSPGPR